MILMTLTTINVQATSAENIVDLGGDGEAADVAAGDYLRGGDISMLNYVESFGAKFYTADGVEKDPLDIMKENGCNIVRLRLYNNPGTPVTYKVDNVNTTYKVPADYLGEDDILHLARRAKQKGLQIELTFHYSDFWTNGEHQIKPAGWENFSYEELKAAVYEYTKQFLQKMNIQGTTPEFVSLGNEIQGGMLFGSYYSRDEVNGYGQENLAPLLAEGSKAVREVCPNSKIIIHLATNHIWNTSTYINYFFNYINNTFGLDFDIVGASYYPFWTNEKPTILHDMANQMYTRYGKDLLIMEVGYSWTQYRPYGRNGGYYEGQLGLNGTPYNEVSKEGQKAFMEEVQDVVENNEHILGYLYWDPIMVDQQVDGSWIETAWAYRQDGTNWWQDGNVVSNTTWFDYEGKALPVFEAIKAAETSGIEDITISSRPSTDTRIYNLQGQQVSPSYRGIVIVGGKKGRKEIRN